MKYTFRIESLPEKEYLVLRGYGKLYDPGVTPAAGSDTETWDMISRRINDGSVERLKMAAGSEYLYMLFCNTCVRNDNEKCYICGYDIACENLSGKKADAEFGVVKLSPCEYAVFTCEFDSETTLRDAHEKPDALFWNDWLKENLYTSAIDEPENWKGNGFAAIEQYAPFDPDANKFTATMWYPILRKER